MSYCTPCPPCDSEFPLLCEPLETTANGKRLVVEDSAACQKTIQSPVAQQVLKTDGAGNLTWTNGASGTVLRKDTTGLVEFATLNSVLQSAPVDLGSQPLTTTGAVTAKTIAITNPSATTALTINQSLAGNGVVINSVDGTSLSIQSTNTNPIKGGTLDFFPATGGDVTFDGAIDGIFAFANTSTAVTKATVFNGANVGIDTPTPGEKLDVNGSIRTNNTLFLNNTAATYRFASFQTNQLTRWDVGTDNTAESGGNVGSDFFIHNFDDAGVFISRPLHITRSTGNIGINTSTPARKLHVNGTVRLQGLPVYANNAAAITGGLVADDVYKTATGELRIVI